MNIPITVKPNDELEAGFNRLVASIQQPPINLHAPKIRVQKHKKRAGSHTPKKARNK